VCRAGASTIAELAAVGIGAVLVPFPAAVDDHQTRNAAYLVHRGAAVLVAEAELGALRLADLLIELTTDRNRRLGMAEAARAAAWPRAEAMIADAVLEAARG